MAMTRSACPTRVSGTVKLVPVARASSPPTLSMRMVLNLPEPGSCSTCQKKLTGVLISPVGLSGVTLSASVTPAIVTVTVWSSATVPMTVSSPTGSSLTPGTRTTD